MSTLHHPSPRLISTPRSVRSIQQHGTFLAVETMLLVALVALGIIVRLHPGPLPGDLGLSLAWQHLIRPNQTLITIIEFFGNSTWPLQAILIAFGIAAVFAYLRRWLDVMLSLGTAGLASLTNYGIMQIVHRPRPVAPGLHVNGHVGFFSFPSGHVEHAVAYYGLILFLTFQVRYPQPWLWLVRVPLILLIVMIGPSRLVTGEHWPSDILGALLWGTCWLLAAIQVYRWAALRWPRLVPANERTEGLAQEQMLEPPAVAT